MKCGETIFVKDVYASIVMRFVAQCQDRFLLISHSYDHLNGYMLTDWRGVIRELVALTVPAKLVEKTRSAESTATGLYVHMPLTYPLSVAGLADLLGVAVDDVRAQLADLAVEVDT